MLRAALAVRAASEDRNGRVIVLWLAEFKAALAVRG